MDTFKAEAMESNQAILVIAASLAEAAKAAGDYFDEPVLVYRWSLAETDEWPPSPDPGRERFCSD